MKALLRKGQIYWGKGILSTTVIKIQGLFKDPEKDTGSRALCEKVKSISELQQQLHRHSSTKKDTYHRGSNWFFPKCIADKKL